MRHSIAVDFCLATLALAVVGAVAMAAAPPDVETRPTAQTQLYIRTVPPDASIQVDGKSQGTAPLLIALPPGVGKVVVEVELGGFQSKTREILVRGGRITRVELKLREAAPAAKQSPTPPASALETLVEPGKLGRLDLRIVPTHAGESKVSLSESEIKQYEKQLQQEGPFVGRDRGDDFGWFQLRCHVSPHLITAEHAGRRFVLLSNRPAEVMLAIGWRSGPWKLHGVMATDDHRGLPSITIEMDKAGGQRVNELTTRCQGSRLAMLVDDQAISIPLIRAPIGRRILITGSFTRDEVDQLIRTLRASVVPPPSSQRPQLRERHFVRLVVGKERMTFEGQETTWEKLPVLLQAVADRSTTVLEVAIASDEMSVRQRNAAQRRAIEMAHRHGFEYPSDIGVHPFGSKGTPSQRVPGR